MSSKDNTQLAVIGAGPGGYPAAFRAADLGMEVTLIDLEENPGGVCLYRGCIPSKALLHVTKLYTELQEAQEWGLETDGARINVDGLREFKNGVVGRLTGGVGGLARQRGVRYVRGHARFKDEATLDIELHEGGGMTLAFEQAVLATGSVPARIPGLPDSPLIMTSREALDLEEVPERLLLIGGGYIGLELGQVYAALGSKVTLVEMMPDILPGADRDLVRFLAKRVKTQFEAVHTETKAESIEVKDGRVMARLTGEGAPDKAEQEFDKVLVSVGRKPLMEDVGIEAIGLDVGDDGFVVVDEQRRTNRRHIFAIGDVAGQPMLAHKATHEGIVAAQVAAGEDVVWDARCVPAVVFSDPEIAWVGLTETQASEQGIEVEVGKFPWGASGRAVTIGRPEGVTKLLSEPESGRILGAGIAGPNAGELIGACALAIEMGAVAEDLALTIQVHPTLGETIMEAAESIVGQATHFYSKKKG